MPRSSADQHNQYDYYLRRDLLGAVCDAMTLVLAPVDVGVATWDWMRTYVWGVVNVTPDSFSDGGQFFLLDRAVERALQLVQQGADVIDIGGESTRPGAFEISVDEELARVIPVIEALKNQIAVPISIDTTKAVVAEQAIASGASIINDISGMTMDRGMAEVVAKTKAIIVISHLRNTPKTMQENINFRDLVDDVIQELRSRIRDAIRVGIRPERILIDPGIGFGKNAQQSLHVMKSIQRIRDEVGYPILVGPSRKSFIGAITGQPVDQRIFGTCSAVAAVIQSGADAVRIHDVAELVPAIRVADSIHRQKIIPL